MSVPFAVSGQNTLIRPTDIVGHSNITTISHLNGVTYFAKTATNQQEIYTLNSTGATERVGIIPGTLTIKSITVFNRQIYFIHDNSVKRVADNQVTIERIAGKAGTTATAIRDPFYGTIHSFGTLEHITVDLTENHILFTDSQHKMIYSLDQEGIVRCLLTGTAEYTGTIRQTDISSIEIGTIADVCGIDATIDGTIYCSARASSMILALKKQFDTQGNVVYLCSTLLGLRQTAGTSVNNETAVYAVTTTPSTVRVNSLYQVFFAEGTSGIKRINPEEYRVYAKGQSGAIRYAPLQLIGNITTEGYVENLAEWKDAISTELYSDNGVADMEGNLYFCDPKIGALYQLDLTGKLKILNPSSPIEKLSYVTLCRNTTLYAITSSGVWASYSLLATTTTTTLTTLSFTMPNIKAVCSHPAGYLIACDSLQIKWVNETAATWAWANGPSVPALPTAMLLDGKNSLWVACVDNRLYQYTVALTTSGLSISTPPTIYGNGSVDAWPFQEGAIASTPIGKCRGIAYHPIDACIYVSTSKRVCRITPYDSSPTIKTFIGTINPGLAIDGAYSAASSIKEPTGIIADYQGNIYIMDQQARNDAGTINSTILIKAPNKLFMRNDYVYCLAGTGKAGYAGDNGPAPLANFNVPRGVAFDTANNIYIADTNNHCVRKIDAITEKVTCIAGIPQQGGSIFNSNPLLLNLNAPQSVAVSQTGTIYITDVSRIIRLTKSGSSYVASVFAGNGTNGVPTLNGLATTSLLGDIRHIIVDNRSNLYVSDASNQKIYKIDTFGRITEVASLVKPGVEGPFELALDPTQSFLYVAFKGEGKVYKINLATSATDVFVSGLDFPVGLCCGPTGDLYVTDQKNHKIKKIMPGGVVTDFLGTGEEEFKDAITPIAGVRDGMYRLQARTYQPNRLAINALGQLIFTEWDNYRIRMVPTAISICEFPCRYIKLDSGSSGQPTIDFFRLYYGDFDPVQYRQRYSDLTTAAYPTDDSLRQHYINTGSATDRDCLPFIDYPSDSVIPTTISSLRYLRIKGGSNCIGMKIFLYNEQRQIIASRVVSNSCQSTNGEVLLLTSPISDCQFVPTPIYTKNVCGVPLISSIEIRVPEVFLLRKTTDTGGYTAANVVSRMSTTVNDYTSDITQTISNTPYTYRLPYPSPRLANSRDLANAVRLGAQWSSAGWAYSESGGIEAYTISQVNSAGSIQRTVNRSTETSAVLSVYGYKVDLPNYTPTNFYTPTSTEMLPARQSLPISKIISKIVIVTKEDKCPITINFNETVDTTSSKTIVFGENLGSQLSATLANKEILGILVYRNSRCLAQDIEGVYIGLIGTSDSGQQSTVAKKVIRMTNPENSMFEFIDFRSSLKGVGCQSIESIYKTAFTYDIIRYIRIKRVENATLNLAEIMVISAESGKNLALGRSLYSSGGTAVTTITTGVAQKTGWNSYSTWDNWVELDLGRGYIIEQIQIYTPLFMNSSYTVEAYTEQRDLVPLPDDTTNPLSNLVKTIRIQHPGYNYNAILGGTEPAESKLTFSRIEAYPLFNPSSNTLGSATIIPSGAAGILSGTTYESQGTGRTEQVAITLPSPTQLTHIHVQNRGDKNSTATGDYYYGRQTFGASVVAENAVGQPIQSFELTGNHLNANQAEVLPMMKGLPGVQYVTVSLPTGYLHFSKLEVYDHRGVNIATPSDVIVSYNTIAPDGSWGLNIQATNPLTAPSEPNNTRLYHSNGTSNEYYDLNFQSPREISCIILYNRNVLNERLNSASLTLTSPMDGGTTRIRQPLRTYTLNADEVQIFWVGTYFPFLRTLPILSSRIGVNEVRYIKLTNTELNTFLTFDQIQVIDVNGINRAASLTNAKMYRSSTSSGTETLELDLGQDIELDYVVFYRNVNGHDNVKFLQAECDALGGGFQTNTGSTNADCTNASRLSGIYTIQALNSDRTILNGTHTTNTLIRQSFDFRQEAFARNSLRFRYLRIEGPGMILTRTQHGIDMGLVLCKLYDIYGRNVCIGKYATAQNINDQVPQGIQSPLLDTNSSCTLYATPGSFWQVDLGQEYSIAEIELKFTPTTNTLNTPVILYNNDFAPVKRLILGKQATNTPFRFGPNDPAVEYALNPAPELQQNTLIQYTVSSIDRGVLARFIHLDGNGTDQLSLWQVIVVDCNGLNVALGKPTYASAAALGDPMNLVNGIGFDSYTSSVAQGAYWEVDLGAEYKICAIILVRATGVGVVRGNRHLRGVFPSSCFSFTISSSSLNTTRHTISVDSAGPQEVYPRTDLGKRCRYLRLLKPFEAGYHWSNLLIFSRVVVSDSFGRNVAGEKYARTIQNDIKPCIVSRNYKSSDWFYHGPTWYSSNNNPNYKGFMWVDIDLGQEYLVTDFSIYAAQYITHQLELFSSSQMPTRVRYITYSNFKASNPNPYIQTRGIRAYDMNGINVARGKPARVHSWDGQPNVNDILMPRITDESMMMYHSQGYISVENITIDLQGDFDIKELVFYNRPDQWSGRAIGAEILLQNSNWDVLARRTLNGDYEQWFSFVDLKEKNLAGNLRILTRDSYQRLTAVEKNSDHSLTWNILQQVGKVTTASTCPVNTIPDGTKCRETCLDGEEDINGRCYQGCPSGTIVNTGNKTECLGCRSGTSVVNDTQCIPDCDAGFDPISMTTCRTACSIDTERQPAGIVANTNVCETLTYDTNSSRIQIVNSLTDLFMQRISFLSFINDITRANSIWGGLYMTAPTYTTESAAGRARRIYTRATETRTRGAIESKATPTARPSREKRLVNKINMPSPSTAPEGYHVIDVNTMGGSVTRSYQKIYDWTSGDKTNFKRFTNNPEYVIGRTFAETTDLLGNGTRLAITRLPILPEPEAATCPSGYTEIPNPTDATKPCKLQQPPSTVELSNKYYYACPSGMAPDSADPATCRTVCPVGFSAENNTTCITSCPSGYTSYTLNGARKCIRCNTAQDQDGQNVTFDTNIVTGTSIPANTILAKQQRLFNARCYKQRYSSEFVNYSDDEAWNHYHTYGYFERRIPGCDEVCITDTPADKSKEYDVYRVAYGENYCEHQSPGVCWSGWRWRPFPKFFAWAPNTTNKMSITRTIGYMGTFTKFIYAFTNIGETQLDYNGFTNQNMWEGDNDDDNQIDNLSRYTSVDGTAGRYRYLKKRNMSLPIYTVPATTTVRATSTRTTSSRSSVVIEYSPKI